MTAIDEIRFYNFIIQIIQPNQNDFLLISRKNNEIIHYF